MPQRSQQRIASCLPTSNMAFKPSASGWSTSPVRRFACMPWTGTTTSASCCVKGTQAAPRSRRSGSASHLQSCEASSTGPSPAPSLCMSTTSTVPPRRCAHLVPLRLWSCRPLWMRPTSASSGCVWMLPATLPCRIRLSCRCGQRSCSTCGSISRGPVRPRRSSGVGGR